MIPKDGMMMLEVREKTFKADDCELMLSSAAFRTSTSKVLLVASTHNRQLTMDFSTVNDSTAKIWQED